jgi:hypothetical protein
MAADPMTGPGRGYAGRPSRTSEASAAGEVGGLCGAVPPFGVTLLVGQDSSDRCGLSSDVCPGRGVRSVSGRGVRNTAHRVRSAGKGTGADRRVLQLSRATTGAIHVGVRRSHGTVRRHRPTPVRDRRYRVLASDQPRRNASWHARPRTVRLLHEARAGARAGWEDRCTALSVKEELTITARHAFPMLAPTPLLMVHGSGDQAVPVSDAREAYYIAGEPKSSCSSTPTTTWKLTTAKTRSATRSTPQSPGSASTCKRSSTPRTCSRSGSTPDAGRNPWL